MTHLDLIYPVAAAAAVQDLQVEVEDQATVEGPVLRVERVDRSDGLLAARKETQRVDRSDGQLPARKDQLRPLQKDGRLLNLHRVVAGVAHHQKAQVLLAEDRNVVNIRNSVQVEQALHKPEVAAGHQVHQRLSPVANTVN